jgi:hypothetical protein
MKSPQYFIVSVVLVVIGVHCGWVGMVLVGSTIGIAVALADDLENDL